jgi:hypothetical protein
MIAGMLSNEHAKESFPEYINLMFHDVKIGDVLKTIVIDGHFSEILTHESLDYIVFKVYR